jgi:hypothetical protein
MRCMRRGLPLGLVTIAALWTLAGTAEAGKDIRLTIDGTADATYDLTCETDDAGLDSNPVTMSGTVPAERIFVADGLVCSVTMTSSSGHLTVEVATGNSTSRSRITGAGATSRVSIR